MKLTEAVINQINEVPKLRYLLISLVQKKEDVSSQNKSLAKQIRLLESKYNAMKADYDTLMDGAEYTQLHQGDVEFERIRGDFNQKACEFLSKLVKNAAQSDAVKKAAEIVDEFRSELSFVIQSQKDNISQTLSEQNKLIKEKTILIEDLKEKADKPISDDVERLLSEKDDAVNQLKGMLQRSVKSDQRNQEQITSLQAQIKSLSEMMTNNSANAASAPVESMTKLEMQIQELEYRLANSSASKELEQKNERLQAMLEKSNRLYSSLDEKYQVLEKLSADKHFYAIVQESLCYEIFDLTPQNAAPLKPENRKKRRVEYDAMVASLRKTLLQYFLCTNESQIDLVPVILEIVGCNAEQISTVMRNIESKKQLINKTGGFFGIFG